MDDTHLLINTNTQSKPTNPSLTCTSIYHQTPFNQKTQNISELVLKSNYSSPLSMKNRNKRPQKNKKSAAELLQWQIHLEIDEALSNIETYFHYTQNNIPPDIQYLQNFPKTLKMYPWNDIQQCLQYITDQTDIPPVNQRLFFHGKEISKLSQPSQNKRRRSPTLYKCGIRNKSVIYLQCNRASKQCPLVTYGPCSVLITNLKECESLIFDSCAGLLQDLPPVLATIGEGGTYFLSYAENNNNNKKYVACFKPSDEEAGCQNNPRNRTSQPMRAGIVRPSTGHIREAAAFLIDCEQHFHGVPPTIRVEMFYHGFHYNSNSNQCLSKIGALQTFVDGEIVENYGMKNFSQRDVHKIGILDIRILNCDRNSANILVQIDSVSHRYSLIPIDHGLSFPCKIEILKDEWIWLSWPQSKVPFDPYTTQFIQAIDIERDIQLLRNEFGLSDICLENMRISNIVLQSGVKYGLTLYDIGSLIARRDFHTPSILELLMAQAETLAEEKLKRMQHKNRRNVGRKLCGMLHIKQPLYKPMSGFMSFSPGLGPTATHIPDHYSNYSPTPMSDYSSSASGSVKFMKKTYTTVIKDPQLIIKSMSSPSQSHQISHVYPPPSLVVKCGAYNRQRLSKYPAPFLTPNLNPTSISVDICNISKTPNPPNMNSLYVQQKSECMPELALASPKSTMEMEILNMRNDKQLLMNGTRKSYGTEGIFTSLAINFDDRQTASPHLSAYSTDSLTQKEREFSLSAVTGTPKIQMISSDDESDDKSDDIPNESSSLFDHQLSRSTSMFALKSQNKSPKSKTLLSNIKSNEEYINDTTDTVKSMIPMERHVTADNIHIEDKHSDEQLVNETIDEHKNAYVMGDSIDDSLMNKCNQTSHLKQREFGIDPIMKRMTHSQNNDLRPTFLHYLQQLLEMQCHRIMRAKKTQVYDEQDAIFDVDTINGAFIWKNEIRKYWSKNMFKLRREERAKERERLINPWQVEHDDDGSMEEEEEFLLFM